MMVKYNYFDEFEDASNDIEGKPYTFIMGKYIRLFLPIRC